MNGDYIQTLLILVNNIAVRLSTGAMLTEEEALLYSTSCAYLRQVNRLLEISARRGADEEEQKDIRDDDDDAAGSTARLPPTPT